MKRLFTNCVVFVSAAAMLTLSSCRDDKDYYDPSFNQKLVDESFDFKTTTNLPVTLNTPTQALVRIYDANPKDNPNAREIYAAYTNERGTYEGWASFSRAYEGKTLYALVNGEVYETKATATGWVLNATQGRAASRVQITDYKQLASDIHETFVTKLPEGSNNEAIINKMGGEEQKDGKNLDIITTTDNTKLQVMFSFSGAGSANNFNLYYYYHPKGTDTKAEYNTAEGKWSDGVDDQGYKKLLKRFNDNKFLLYSGFNNTSYPQGQVKDLLFYGEDLNQTAQEAFPKDYEIGFILVWNEDNDNGRQRPKYTTGWPNWSCAPEGENTWSCQRQATRFNYGTDILVYGFEDIGYNWVRPNEPNNPDNCDKDFNDCIFAVIVDNGSIEKPDAPDIKPEDPEPETYTETRKGLLLFEDLFPQQGDYDMNDVVVEYEYVITFDRDNIVQVIEAYYTPIWDGADYSNSFGVILEQITDHSNNRAARLHNELIFEDHKALKTSTEMGAISCGTFYYQFTQTEFGSSLQKDDLQFNPYITVTNTGHEVHLTKMQPTEKYAKSSQYQALTVAQQNYVTTVGMAQDKFPYALDICDAESSTFTIVTERMRIDTQYPNFTRWVESEGESANDWWRE